MNRQPLGDDAGKDKTVQVRMTERLAEEARGLANSIGVSMSALLRMALIEKLARHRRELEKESQD